MIIYAPTENETNHHSSSETEGLILVRGKELRSSNWHSQHLSSAFWESTRKLIESSEEIESS
jgi:hypothetical protein